MGLLLAGSFLTALAQQDTIATLGEAGAHDIDYQVGLVANFGNSELAPYYISSNTGGIVTQQTDALLTAALWHMMDPAKRLSWGAGVELWGGYGSSAAYDRYLGDDQWTQVKQHPSRLWVQQAYLEGKYRSIHAVVGGRYKHSPVVNDLLSSGDMVWSVNARPPMGVMAGFIDFQDIPLTGGWLQLMGEFGYFRGFDDKWLENHYNYYNHFITTGTWLHYKSLHFRTRPDQPLVFTIGAQAACQFGGAADYYKNGEIFNTVQMDADAKAFLRTFIAGSGGNSSGDSFVEGNHLGTWDVALDYNLLQDRSLRCYAQMPWEDGSGIGKFNGLDGLWGLEYRDNGSGSLVSGAVFEFMELTNHSGPIHWAPADHPGTPIVDEATGADDYYNNYIYNGFQSHGMSIGSPFVKSPLYNLDGYMRYRDNVMRGFHAAVSGNLSSRLNYRLMGSYRKAWGTPMIPRAVAVDDFSMSLQAGYSPAGCEGLQVAAQFAVDRGSLYGDNVGAVVSIHYHGNFNFNKR